MTNNDKRVLLSLTQVDVDKLFTVLYALNSCYEREEIVKLNDAQVTCLREWVERTNRIYDHMTDSVDIHFTDLGT